MSISHYLKFHPKDTSKKIYLTKKYDEIFFNNVPADFGKSDSAQVANPEKLRTRFVLLSHEKGDTHKELLQAVDDDQGFDFEKETEDFKSALQFVQDEIDKTLKDTQQVEEDIKRLLNDEGHLRPPQFKEKD